MLWGIVCHVPIVNTNLAGWWRYSQSTDGLCIQQIGTGMMASMRWHLCEKAHMNGKPRVTRNSPLSRHIPYTMLC
jgi:hypothetical protein